MRLWGDCLLQTETYFLMPHPDFLRFDETSVHVERCDDKRLAAKFVQLNLACVVFE